MSQIPISLYIHFPWCSARCHYCDFNAHQKPKIIPERPYLKALENQLFSIHQKRIQLGDTRKKLMSVFIGGGTPSLIKSETIAQILEKVSQYFDINDAEISLEANPESVNQAKFKALKKIGINRVSIGVQSFNPLQLQALSRVHSGDQARYAIEMALDYFDNINVDLMYGLVKQSEEEALADIEKALHYPIHHLSYYELTIEPNTYFHHFPPQLTSEKKTIQIQKNAIQLMKLKGFKQYEVSAYSLDGTLDKHQTNIQKNYQCQHNLNYWQFGDYLAIGAGGSAKLSFIDNDNKLKYYRYQAPKQPNQFINWANNLTNQQSQINYQEIGEKDTIFEFFLNASRLTEGFNSDLLTQRTGIKIWAIQTQLKKLIDQDLLEPIDDFEQAGFLIKPTKRGFKYLNEIPQYFL